jgi:hypothetical protein
MKLSQYVALFVGIVLSGAASGQADEQARLLARRAAEADAMRKLAECVYGIQLNSRTYVKDFVAESDEIRGAVDAFVKGIRLGDARFYADGSCEVPAEVTTAKVVEVLRQVHQKHYRGKDVTVSDFDSVTRRTEKQIIRVVGSGAVGAVRPEPPPASPGEQAAPAPGAPPPPLPEIWQQVGAQGRLLALRMARLDAMRRLAERIKGLRLTAQTQVRDFVAESDVITTELSDMLVGAEEVGVFLRPNELIAEVTMTVPTEQVISAIKTLHSRHYKGDDLRSTDIESTARSVVTRDFTETGRGIPPPQYLKRYEEIARVDLPDWAMGPIEAIGAGTDPAMDTPAGKLKAARAAEMDARRKLAERIGSLRITAERTMQDFTTEHDHLVALVDGLIVDAQVTHTRFDRDQAFVTVQIPGLALWSIVQEEQQRAQRPR